MLRTIIFALTTALATAATANNSGITIVGGTTAHIRYGDIDLHSTMGQHQLGGRIRRAAEMICTDGSTNLMPFGSPRVECYRAAVAQGVSQMHVLATR
jgi:UrcA family protein